MFLFSFFVELAYTARVDTKSDVYSFGVVTLEVIMGRHPGELVSSLLSMASSSSSPSRVYHLLLMDVLDHRLSPPVHQVSEEVVHMVKIACACLHANPQCRPNMEQVYQKLSNQWPPLSKPFSMITLGELLGHGDEISWHSCMYITFFCLACILAILLIINPSK